MYTKSVWRVGGWTPARLSDIQPCWKFLQQQWLHAPQSNYLNHCSSRGIGSLYSEWGDWGITRLTLVFNQICIGHLVPKLKRTIRSFPGNRWSKRIWKLGFAYATCYKNLWFSVIISKECSIRGTLFYIPSTELALLHRKWINKNAAPPESRSMWLYHFRWVLLWSKGWFSVMIDQLRVLMTPPFITDRHYYA